MNIARVSVAIFACVVAAIPASLASPARAAVAPYYVAYTIPDPNGHNSMSGPGYLAMDPETNTLFSAINSDPVVNSGSLATFDGARGSLMAKLTSGTGLPSPSGVAVDPAKHEAFVTSNGSAYKAGCGIGGTVGVIDTVSGRVIAAIRDSSDHGLSGTSSPAVDSSAGKVYVLNCGTASVSVIDEATNTLLATTPQLSSNRLWGSPGLALNESTHKIYVGDTSGNSLFVLDGGTNSLVTTIPMSSPAGIGVDTSSNLIYVSNSTSGTVSVINGTTNVVASVIPVGPDPGPLAVGGGKLLVANQGDQTVSVIDTSDNSTISTLQVPADVRSVTFDPRNQVGFVSSGALDGAGTISVIAPSPTVSRISGVDRFATSVALAEAGYPTTAPVVLLATGTNYPDALAAGPAAAVLGGPLLLTRPDLLPSETASEIASLHPSKVLIVGGVAAVSASVESQVRSIVPNVRRIAGADRFDTARQLAGFAFPAASKVYVATGMNYPDALSAAAAAGSQGRPLLLVNGSEPSLDAATTSLLANLSTKSATIVGGDAAVSPGLEASLSAALGGPSSVNRLGGSDRFFTSADIALDSFSDNPNVFIATGLQFPDALAGSALAAAKHAPLLTSLPDCLPAPIVAELVNLKSTSVALIGGPNALSGNVARLTPCL